MKSIVNLLNNIKSGYQHNNNYVSISRNNVKIKFLKYLCELGYIRSYEIIGNMIKIYLINKEKFKSKNSIKIKIVSKRSYKIYKKYHEIDDHYNQIELGHGYNRNKSKVNKNFKNERLRTVIISTTKGLMTQSEASYLKLGGEIICIIN